MSTSWQDEYASDTGREVSEAERLAVLKRALPPGMSIGMVPGGPMEHVLDHAVRLTRERDALRAELEDVRRRVRKLHGGFATTGTGLVARKGMRIAFPDLFTEADDGE